MQEKAWQDKNVYTLNLIKQINPIPDLVNKIKTLLPNISSSEITTILTELYNNSVDHGLLNLSSEIKTEQGLEKYYQIRKDKLNALTKGSVVLTLAYEPIDQILTIHIIDSGVGFDYKKYTAMPLMLHKVSGKGLYIIHRLADKVDYRNSGTDISVRYKVRTAEELPDAQRLTSNNKVSPHSSR